MKVILTGATGFIGSHVLAELQKQDHEVTALVRDDNQANIVAARGATPTVVDLYDRPTVARLLVFTNRYPSCGLNAVPPQFPPPIVPLKTTVTASAPYGV